MPARLVLEAFATLVVSFGLLSCAATYYRALETFGIEKRDILVNRVEDARASQEAAKEQFSSALEQYRAVIEVEAGDLEDIYDRLDAEYARSEDRASTVRERVDEVAAVADDLFEEWEDELEQYADPGLRRQSQRLLAQTRAESADVLRAMRRAEQAMDPVLTLFEDQVLILRHNLNARAIGSLENELESIERATAALIEEMERAIAEASQFIEAMA